MDNLLLSSDGAAVGGLWLPPFRLHRGESACLHIPGLACGEQEERVLCGLSGADTISGIRVLGRVEYAAPATSRAGLLGLFRRPYPVDWLRRTARLNPGDARGIVAKLDLKPEWRVCNLPGTPRSLLGLEAAWARGADVVVFSCVGLDPCGRQAMFDAVRTRLGSCAAIYLSYAYATQGRSERDHLPGASCLDVTKPTGDLPLSLPA
jgi:hypothetical protein